MWAARGIWIATGASHSGFSEWCRPRSKRSNRINLFRNGYVPPKGKSDEWSDVFVVSGFELYGYLEDAAKPRDKEDLEAEVQERFPFRSDRDGKGKPFLW